ncbi:unnamed protein product [Vitrella brassicaformis CCMP3155]|uniref:Uncharacterized protein n=2 Tax=Vitrella brassicaformis TaxID=1169539 RepID=A0A0G4GAI5_VITBC|nr:unnamed protein product [Vitrella brassicaformis CCMP3155]|eukprot:CEM25978.1 unnamed protein product [Vitrella brassicaformis CCMP3155]
MVLGLFNSIPGPLKEGRRKEKIMRDLFNKCKCCDQTSWEKKMLEHELQEMREHNSTSPAVSPGASGDSPYKPETDTDLCKIGAIHPQHWPSNQQPMDHELLEPIYGYRTSKSKKEYRHCSIDEKEICVLEGKHRMASREGDPDRYMSIITGHCYKGREQETKLCDVRNRLTIKLRADDLHNKYKMRVCFPKSGGASVKPSRSFHDALQAIKNY